MRKNAYKEKQTVAAESMHSKIKPNTGEKMNEYTMDPRRREGKTNICPETLVCGHVKPRFQRK